MVVVMSDFGAVFAFMGGLLFVMLGICLAVYLVNALGYKKLFEAAGYEPTWAMFVPIFGNYALGMFLKEENGDADWVGWLIAFYWVLSLIPILGSFCVLAGAIFTLVKQFQWMQKRNADTICYILLFLFPLAVPFLMAKKYE